jgi:hypothetical protein
MSKKVLSERDICTKFITPALEQAGWHIATQIREEFPLTRGRIIVRGKLHTRAKHKRADYVLFYKPNMPLAVIEAKDANHSIGDGMQQSLGYADLLQVPFVFSSNGEGFLFHNKIAKDGVIERELALHEIPSPDTLWQWWSEHLGLNPAQGELVSQDYYSDGSNKTPRYYQLLAINKTIEAIAKGQNRTCAKESVINLFEFDGEKVALPKVNKADVIKSLSAGLITFSESEARLNIQHVLKNTFGPVLFTEGITDEMILETAWTKLYPTEKRCFEIQNAFSCGFQRNLIKDNALYQNHPGRTFFSLFDFDEAYNDWNQLGQDVQTDPALCLAKKRANCESYALLLPVPATGKIRQQVINPHTGGNFGNKSLLTIELLFHSIAGLDAYFTVDTERTDGFIKFVSDSQKVTFARDVVPTIDAVHFAVFRPLFEFIKSKCDTAANGSQLHESALSI